GGWPAGTYSQTLGDTVTSVAVAFFPSNAPKVTVNPGSGFSAAPVLFDTRQAKPSRSAFTGSPQRDGPPFALAEYLWRRRIGARTALSTSNVFSWRTVIVRGGMADA